MRQNRRKTEIFIDFPGNIWYNYDAVSLVYGYTDIQVSQVYSEVWNKGENTMNWNGNKRPDDMADRCITVMIVPVRSCLQANRRT